MPPSWDFSHKTVDIHRASFLDKKQARGVVELSGWSWRPSQTGRTLPLELDRAIRKSFNAFLARGAGSSTRNVRTR